LMKLNRTTPAAMTIAPRTPANIRHTATTHTPYSSNFFSAQMMRSSVTCEPMNRTLVMAMPYLRLSQ
jgi:hypothetical protein